MKVRAIAWTGVQTERFDEMGRVMRALFGTEPPIEQPGFALWSLPDGSLVELFAPGHKPTFGTGPVVGFLVDDLERSRADLVAAGAEIVGGYGPNEDGYTTIHFKAPDGNVYEIVYDPAREARAARHAKREG